jgi:Tyrosyl-DNA phosphodiesterase
MSTSTVAYRLAHLITTALAVCATQVLTVDVPHKGKHHSKIVILVFDTGIRVIITTANFSRRHWDQSVSPACNRMCVSVALHVRLSVALHCNS